MTRHRLDIQDLVLRISPSLPPPIVGVVAVDGAHRSTVSR